MLRLIVPLMLLVACDAIVGNKQAPPQDSTPPDQAWRLIGRVTPDRSTLPDAPPFEGGRALIKKCGTLRPCAAERWRKQSGEHIDLLRVRDEIHHPDGSVWNGRWWSISGVLRACIGDPLSVPPTHDPGAYRQLVIEDKGPRWRIHLSGENQCGLEGLIVLNGTADRLDLSLLRCDGKPWKRDGRACAKANLAKATQAISE